MEERREGEKERVEERREDRMKGEFILALF